MTLDEVRQLLSFRDNPAGDCSGVNKLVDEHMEHVATRITSLQALQKQLMDLRRSCTEGREVSDCQILHQLNVGGNHLGEEVLSHVGRSHNH